MFHDVVVIYMLCLLFQSALEKTIATVQAVIKRTYSHAQSKSDDAGVADSEETLCG